MFTISLFTWRTDINAFIYKRQILKQHLFIYLFIRSIFLVIHFVSVTVSILSLKRCWALRGCARASENGVSVIVPVLSPMSCQSVSC